MARVLNESASRSETNGNDNTANMTAKTKDGFSADYIIEHPELPDIDVPANTHYTEFFLKRLKNYGNSTAMIDAANGNTASYSDLLSNVLAFAYGLQEVFNFAPLDCVLLMLHNSPEFIAAHHGTLAACGRFSPASYLNGPHEIDHCLSMSSPRIMVLLSDKLPMIATLLSKRKLTGHLTHPFGLITVGDLANETVVEMPENVTVASFESVLAAGRRTIQQLSTIINANALDCAAEKCIDRLREFVDVKNDWVGLYHSSGTTGLPKGVMHSHCTLLANNLTCKAGVKFEIGERVQAILPFYHMFGSSKFVMSGLSQGVTLVYRAVFDKDCFFSDIADYGIQTTFAVPPLIMLFTQDDKCLQYDLSSLRRVYCSAAPLSAGTEQEARAKLPQVEILQLYGMSEVGCQLVCPYKPRTAAAAQPIARDNSSHTEFTRNNELVTHSKKPSMVENKHPGSSGCVYPGVRLKLVDIHDDNKTVNKPGERGQLALKSQTALLGYLNNESATREMMPYSDGWVFTGDIAYFDEDHYVYIVDRIKEIIKYKGHQIAPAELEAVILEQQGVTDAAVIGVPAPGEDGEHPFAFVVLAAGTAETDRLREQLADSVSQSVAAYKKIRARHITFVDHVPRSAIGKILRKELRQKYSKMQVEPVQK